MGEHLDCPTRAHTAHRGEGWRSTRIPHLTPITQGPRADHPVLSARLMSLLPSLQSSKSMPSDGPSPPKYVSALPWRWDEQWAECTIYGPHIGNVPTDFVMFCLCRTLTLGQTNALQCMTNSYNEKSR